jgi:hypothetical protein
LGASLNLHPTGLLTDHSMESSPKPPAQKVAIPEALRLQLDDFRRHLWRVKIMEALAAGIIGLLVSFLLVYGLDRIWQTPAWARLVILLGGVSLFAGFAPYWLHRWVWRQRRENQLARLIAKRYPGLGDRLLGVIELQDQLGNEDTLSPRLREAAMQAVAAEVAKRSLGDALPPQKHRRWALVALGLAMISAAAFLFTPRAGSNALWRWIMPLSGTERYTFTRLENPPQYRAVPYGEAFGIELRLSKDSEQRPPQAEGRYGMQPAVTAVQAGGVYQFSFPGQQDPGTITFKVGDLRHQVRVEPVPRPSMESVVAVISPPPYLGIPERTQDFKSGVIQAVEGSKMQIQLTANRALASANFGPTRAQVLDETSTNRPPYQPVEGGLDVSGLVSKTPSLEIGSVPFEIPFSWEDRLGLAGESGFRLRVDAFRDAVPTCYLQGVDRQKVMLPEETVDFELLAEDDFGVRQVGIEWTGQFTRPSADTPAKGELKIADGGSEEQRVGKDASFSPLAFGIPPQKIVLRAYAEDYFPGRERVYSEPVILYVLTRDEHAQMLKAKFDRAITELEDLARRELELYDENQRIERLSGEELQKEENTKRLEAQDDAEAESERRMQGLTETMENLMKDAARNGDIQKETLKKMAESLKSMQELSQSDLPKVQEKLQDSQDASNTPEKARKDVAEAVAEQKKAIEKMQDAIAKANDASKQFEAGTFVNRLKKAATEQSGIASSLVDAFERILGVKLSKVDPSDLRRLEQASAQQANTASDIRWLQEDLANYFVRTQALPFKEILDEMKSTQIDVGLESVRTLLATNHSFVATETSKKWADQLTAWAKKLDGEKDQDKNGAGGSGGSPDPEDEDFEFMLRVMKLIQQEQDLRSQTRVLEQFRRTSGATEP